MRNLIPILAFALLPIGSTEAIGDETRNPTQFYNHLKQRIQRAENIQEVGVLLAEGIEFAATYRAGQGEERSCRPPGREMLGACWYLGEAGQSCNDVCSGQGKIYDSKTRSVAGSGSNGEEGCQTLADEYGYRWGSSYSNNSGAGCYISSGTVAYRVTESTTAGGSNSSYARFCACKSP